MTSPATSRSIPTRRSGRQSSISSTRSLAWDRHARPSRPFARKASCFPRTASTAIRVLNNPRFAGAYTYGRRRYRRAIDGKRTLQRRDQDDWLACIPDAHPGYISWELFQENLKVLKTNGQGYEVARASPPREGTVLLQGRAVCGRCGKHFRIRYASRRGRLEAWYVCDRATAIAASPTASRSLGLPSTRPSAC